jgi:hypothetical protein
MRPTLAGTSALSETESYFSRLPYRPSIIMAGGLWSRRLDAGNRILAWNEALPQATTAASSLPDSKVGRVIPNAPPDHP